jgi:hypothetical protein
VAPAETRVLPATLGSLNCGDWPPSAPEELERLGVHFFLYHPGVYRQARIEGAWFAWQALQAQGYRAVATGGAVSLLVRRDGPRQPPPVAEPDRDEPVLCSGWNAGRTGSASSSLWIWGEGEVVVTLESLEPAIVRAGVDGKPVSSAMPLDGRGSVSVGLGAAGWHLVRLEATASGIAFVRVAT